MKRQDQLGRFQAHTGTVYLPLALGACYVNGHIFCRKDGGVKSDGELRLRGKEMSTKPTVSCSELQRTKKRRAVVEKQSTDKLPIDTAPSPQKTPLMARERSEGSL